LTYSADEGATSKDDCKSCPEGSGALVSLNKLGRVVWLGVHGEEIATSTESIHGASGVCGTADGGAVVADTKGNRIVWFDNDGAYLRHVSFRHPKCIAAVGNKFVVSEGADLVWLDSDGREEFRVQGLKHIKSVAALGDGGVIALDKWGRQIACFKKRGGECGSYGDFLSPKGVAAAGNVVLLADGAADEVVFLRSSWSDGEFVFQQYGARSMEGVKRVAWMGGGEGNYAAASRDEVVTSYNNKKSSFAWADTPIAARTGLNSDESC
jgi:hypothetical protein